MHGMVDHFVPRAESRRLVSVIPFKKIGYFANVLLY
jgi:hypothetical protein